MNNNELDINKILLLLKSNLLTIVISTVIFFSAVAIYAYFLVPVYSSSVTLSIAKDKSANLQAVLPGQLSQISNDVSRDITSIKLTIKSKKFIRPILEKVQLNQHFFIEKKLKKIETSEFQEVKLQLTIINPKLNNTYIKIEPIDDTHFILSIQDIDFKETYKFNEEIKNSLFQLKVLRKDKLKEQAYYFKYFDKTILTKQIINNLQVHSLSDNVIQITFTDTLPSRAQKIVDEIAKYFIQYTLDKKTSEVKQTLNFLDVQIFEIKENLNLAGKRLREYQAKNSSFISLDSSADIYENITLKDDAIKNLQLQLNEITTFSKNLQKNKLNTVALINSGIETSSIQSIIELYRAEETKIDEIKFQKNNISKPISTDTKLNQLIESLEINKIHLNDLLISFTSDHPQVLLTQQKTIEKEREIYAYINRLLQKATETKKRLKNQIASNISMVKENLKSKLIILEKDLNSKKNLLKSLPEKDLAIQDLKRKFTLSEHVYTFLLQKKMEMDMKQASTISDTQIIEDASLPLFPIKPKKKMIVAVGAILGLILGIAFVFLRELLDTKIRDVATIEALTDAPLYGTLPDVKQERFFKEALRNVRTNLQFVLPNDKHCINLLVSSTVSGEGKTTIIAGLAEIIAQTDKKVLLMDLDLRKPRLYKEVKKSNKVGMSNYLTADLNYNELIQTVNDNLDFFPAGNVPPNPSELLMSNKFEKTITALMEKYDYILFDTPPIGSVTDANMLLKYTDLLLLVVRANIADKIYLKNFNKMREEKNIKSAGIILNHMKLVKDRHYGYGYGYGYGYDYGYGQNNKKGQE